MKLADSHLVILSKAARRDDRCRELPKSMPAAAAEKFVAKLAASGSIEEIETADDLPAWRTVEGQRYSLRITNKGMAGIGVIPDKPVAPANEKAARRSGSSQPKRPSSEVATRRKGSKPASWSSRAKATARKSAKKAAARSGTKIAEIVNLLSRKRGATIEELAAATGWQVHSVRGAISGTVRRKLGHKIISEVQGDARRYRLAGTKD